MRCKSTHEIDLILFKYFNKTKLKDTTHVRNTFKFELCTLPIMLKKYMRFYYFFKKHNIRRTRV